jgi:taurine dioxygenase
MRFEKLHQNFGAEVTYFDPCAELSASDLASLRAALAEHLLLVFRMDRQISTERQAEINNEWFGPRVDIGNQPLFSVLHSDEPAGAAVLRFHSDWTYTDHPIKLISLQATQVPRGGTSTSFVSGIDAWASLSTGMQDRLSNLTAQHVQDSSITAQDMPVFRANQPLRFDHPRAGKPVLMVTEYHTRRINELPENESRELLDRLFEHLYQPENIYTHRWQRYDLVVWDNLAVQHARREAANPADGPRAMQRVAFNDVPYEKLIELARQM